MHAGGMVEAGGDVAARPARRRLLLGAVLVGAAPLVVFWRATIGEVMLASGDALVYFMPMRQMAAQYLAAGHLPLWNPYQFSGFPFLAASQPAVLHPGTLLFLVLPTLWAANIQMLATYSVAAVGTYVYARSIGCDGIGAALGGLTFAFNGFMIGHLGHTGVVQSAALLPVLLVCLERQRETVRFGALAGGAAAIAIAIFAGHPQVPLLLVLTGAVYTAFVALADRPASRWRFALAGAATLACGLLLGAVQLFPTAELADESVRAAPTFEQFVSFALPVQQIPMMLMPFLFGGNWDHAYFGEWSLPHELCGYTGLAALMLAAAALRYVWRDRLTLFWLVVAVVSFLLTLGAATPLARLAYHIPVVNLFRGAARNFLLFDMAIAVLAAQGLSRAGAALRGPLVAAALAVGGATLAVAGLAVVYGQRIWGRLADANLPGGFSLPLLADAFSLRNPALLVPIVLAVATTLAVLAMARRATPLRRSLVLGIQAVDLVALVAMLPRDLLPGVRVGIPPMYVKFLLSQHVDPAAERIAAVFPGTYRTGRNDFALWNVAQVNGYDPLILARYRDLAGGMTYFGTIEDWVLARQPAFLDLLNTGYIVSTMPPCQLGQPLPAIDRLQQKINLSATTDEPLILALPKPVSTAQLALVSYLSHAAALPDGTPVARIVLENDSQTPAELLVRAGEHTSEWARRRPNVAAAVRHREPTVDERFSDGIGETFLATLPLPEPRLVSALRIEALVPGVRFTIARLSLQDAAAGVSCPLTALHAALADRDRWETVFNAEGYVVVLHNRKRLPRAWLVGRTERQPADAVLRTIQTGGFADGRRFDPRLEALVEDEPGREFGPLDPESSARIARYEPNRVELETHSAAPAFLMLSDVFFPGWSASVDGVPATLVRADYALRGVAVPAGEHRVEIVYRPRVVLTGAIISALTAAALVVVGVARVAARRRHREGG